MRLEDQEQGESDSRGQYYSSSPASAYSAARMGAATAAREQANRWLARFAPLVSEANQTRTAVECRARIRTVRELRDESESVKTLLEAHAGPEEAHLLTTLQSAIRATEEIEANLRRHLARLAPGDPDSLVDLDALREDLAEVEARREIGVGFSQGLAPLTLNTSTPNWGTAAFMGIFACGWLAFTTFHATLMIGGMFMAFRWFALFLLAFYAIFWAVGIGMAKTALDAMASESIELNGSMLTVRRKGPFGTKETVYGLGPGSRAEIVIQQQMAQGRNRGPSIPGLEIAMRAADGREIRIARNALPEERQEFARRINDYLRQTAS
jgi:uncharacterized membrane protein